MKALLDTNVVLDVLLARQRDDFEDNLQIACAAISGLDAIVTRDKSGFVASAIAVLTPAEALSQLSEKPTTL